MTLRILHLEDNDLDGELAVAHLEDGGHKPQVHRVWTREEFEDALYSEEAFDIIIADYSLPAFDGFTALQMARSQRPDVPFLFLSGALGEERAIETLKNGATDYVLKDNLDRLVPSIDRALREAKVNRERRRAEEALRFLAEAGAYLMASRGIEGVLRDLAHLCVPRLGDMCFTETESHGHYHLVSAVPEGDETAARALLAKIAEQGGVSAEAQLHAGREVLIHSESIDGKHEPLCVLRVPLAKPGRLIGVFTLVRTASGAGNFDDQDIELAQSLAQRASLAADNELLLTQTRDALHARDDFLATVSHELRTPLNSILGWANLLSTGELDIENMHRAAETIERNARVQSQLIDDLLDVSRIIAGKLRLSLEEVRVTDAVRAALDAVRPAAQAKEIVLHEELDEPGIVRADANRLQQIVWNLLSNAIKFTPRGGQITLQARREAAGVILCVRDSGEGIAPEFLPFVFDRFRQGETGGKRSHGGLGLGLSIVRHLAELHGGTVEAESEGVGKGATFSVRLPLRTQ
jgi:signal transduction histidine kinase/CheY-like chemotaxis protein